VNRRAEQTLLLLILLLAAVLRMGWPGVVEFKLDEAKLSRLALDMARGRTFPLHGIVSSVGVPNPPISVYLFALPYAFSADPTLATLFVGLLNVMAVGLTWWLARRCFGARAGLLAAALYAASPWGVIYSRKIWAQDLLPPFVLLTVITGLLGFVEGKGGKGRWRYQVAHFALLALTVQIHLSALALIPLTVALLVVGRTRIDRRSWLGVGLAALTLVPFALAVFSEGWLQAIGGALQNGGHSIVVNGDALYHAHLVISGTQIHALAAGPDPNTFYAYLDSVPDLWPLLALEGWAALAAALWLVASGLRGAKRERLILGLWALLPVLTFTVQWTPSYPHYMIPLLPAAYIALAAGAKALARMLSRWVRLRAAQAALTGLALVIAASQVYLAVSLLSFIDTHDTSVGFGTLLRHLLEVRDAARTLAGEREILLVSRGDEPAFQDDPAVWDFLLYDHAPGVRFVDGRRELVFPAEPALLVTTPDFLPSDPAARYPPSAVELLLRQPSEGQYRLTLLDDQPEDWPGEPIGARLANGVTLLTWDYDEDGFWLTWQAAGPARPDRGLRPPVYTLFVHLLDADGARIAQADVPAWPGNPLGQREGDVIVTRFELEMDTPFPAGVRWRVGMYTLLADGSIQNVDVLDEAGNPAGQWVDLPTR
jgi:4-amino-4-deoxy-L-arabinose transferase-like glycosyltransferase